jgi:hypothetical protein
MLLYMTTNIHFLSDVSFFLSMRNVSKLYRKSEKNISYSVTFFYKIVPFVRKCVEIL